MSVEEKPMKMSRQLKLKAQEFLSCKENVDYLVEMVKEFEYGADRHLYLLPLEFIFTNLLKDRDMFIHIVPLKPVEKTQENQQKEYLRNIYEDTYLKIVKCLESSSHKLQAQGLSTAMNILSAEGKHPLEMKGNLESYVPLPKLKIILMKILSSNLNNEYLINKYTEYLQYDDVLFFTWKLLPYLTAKSNPNETYILNYLKLLRTLQVSPNSDTRILCEDSTVFEFDQSLIKKNINKIWHCLMHWEHTKKSHEQMLFVLLENIMQHLEKSLLITDFLMDSLDLGGVVSILALQGLLTLIRDQNIEYPNIFGKLYSMFEPEIFHTKYKVRLFYLADLFLKSTHLPEILVAAFVKRLARLALIAPSEDIIIICNFIGNLILRHPGLKRMLDNPDCSTASTDPYVMEERDPVKSNAINSSLWEIQTLQNHVQPGVANAAKFINSPLPCCEWEIGNILDNTSDDIFDKEVKKYNKMIVLQFDKPHDGSIGRNERLMSFWSI